MKKETEVHTHTHTHTQISLYRRECKLSVDVEDCAKIHILKQNRRQMDTASQTHTHTVSFWVYFWVNLSSLLFCSQALIHPHTSRHTHTSRNTQVQEHTRANTHTHTHFPHLCYPQAVLLHGTDQLSGEQERE